MIVPPPSWPHLDTYVNGGPASHDLAKLFPAVGSILSAFSLSLTPSAPPQTFLAFLAFLLLRSQTIFTSLVLNHSPPVLPADRAPLASPAADSWKMTGSCYGQDPIRERPKYPRMKNDGEVEKIMEMETCRKYLEV